MGAYIRRNRKWFKNFINELNVHSNRKDFDKYTNNKLPVSEREKILINKLNKQSNNTFFVDYSAIALENRIVESICKFVVNIVGPVKQIHLGQVQQDLKQLIVDKKINYLKKCCCK